MRNSDDDLLNFNNSDSRKIVKRSEDERPVLKKKTEVRKKTDVKKKTDNSKKKASKKKNVFFKGLAVYAGALIVLGMIFLTYTDITLRKYEKSQSEVAMKDFLKEFESMVKKNTLTDNVEIPSSSEFEAENLFEHMYMETFKDIKEYRFEKDSSNYSTESPSYKIFADDNYVARMTLKIKKKTTALGFLSITRWDIDKIEPVFGAGVHNYVVNIPDNMRLTVNGKDVSDNYKTGKTSYDKALTNIIKYVNIPKNVEYKINGLVNKPVIKAYKENGEEVQCIIDDNGNVSLAESFGSNTIPKERKDEAYKMAETWENFLTNDLSGAYHGLYTVQKYLIKDSYYWNIAEEYAKSVDITFISDHTVTGFSDIVIDNYIEYSPNCYSCHIAFKKNMRLTTGGSRVDALDSTFYFVYYDDTDDGVDNPHWAIADMIATTK